MGKTFPIFPQNINILNIVQPLKKENGLEV